MPSSMVDRHHPATETASPKSAFPRLLCVSGDTVEILGVRVARLIRGLGRGGRYSVQVIYIKGKMAPGEGSKLYMISMVCG